MLVVTLSAHQGADHDRRDGPAPVPRSVLAAAHLCQWRSKAHSDHALSLLGRQLHLQTLSHLRDVLRATARECQLMQDQLSDSLATYVSAMVTAGVFLPVALIHRLSFDETPLKLAAMGDHGMVTTLCKLFVYHSSWGAVVRSAEDGSAFLLNAAWSPLLRTAESTCGECVAGVLRSAPVSPKQLEDLFRKKALLRCVETDEAGGNIRGERLFQSSRGDLPWIFLHSFCAAHKIHLMSERTWGLSKGTLKGALRSLLLFSSAAHFSKSLHTLVEEIPKMCQVVYNDLSTEGQQYRKSILNSFLPTQPSKRSWVITSSMRLLNSDWRVPNVLMHRCGPGCCRDKEHSQNGAPPAPIIPMPQTQQFVPEQLANQ